MATALESPPAPQAPPAPTNPESKQTINVVPQPIEPTPPPKPGSVRASMREALAKKATGGEAPAQPAAPAAAPATPEQPTPASAPSTSQNKPAGQTEPGAPDRTPEVPTPGSAPTEEKGAKKPSPWKLVDQYKTQNAELQRQLAEKSQLPEQEKKRYLEQIESIQKRNQELEDRIRFVDYRKSTEFKEKYEQPYQKAWDTAMSELQEIPVFDESGQARALTPQDIMNVVNLPLVQAKEIAKQQFGEFADDVMAHRKQIRQLWDAQAKALAEAEKTGAEREKSQKELTQKQAEDMRNEITQTWTAANEMATKDPKHGKYFSPIEGDEDGNARLQRGYELVDQAFKSSPLDPNLTPEQRATVVKQHAAIRNRAAAYGRLVGMVEKRDARIAELEKKLSAYEESAPPASGRQAESQTPSGPGTAREQLHAALRAKAQ